MRKMSVISFPGKAMHWFTRQSREACVQFVTFDRTYDIVWAKPQR